MVVVLRIVALVMAIFCGLGVTMLPTFMVPFAKDRGSRWALVLDLGASIRNITPQGRGLLIAYGLCWAGLIGGLLALFATR